MKSALLLLDLQNEMVDPKGKVGAHGLAKIVEDRGVLVNAFGARTVRAVTSRAGPGRGAGATAAVSTGAGGRLIVAVEGADGAAAQPPSTSTADHNARTRGLIAERLTATTPRPPWRAASAAPAPPAESAPQSPAPARPPDSSPRPSLCPEAQTSTNTHAHTHKLTR